MLTRTGRNSNLVLKKNKLHFSTASNSYYLYALSMAWHAKTWKYFRVVNSLQLYPLSITYLQCGGPTWLCLTTSRLTLRNTQCWRLNLGLQYAMNALEHSEVSPQTLLSYFNNYRTGHIQLFMEYEISSLNTSVTLWWLLTMLKAQQIKFHVSESIRVHG